MLGFAASCECSIASAKHGVCLGDNILVEGGGDGTILVHSHLPTLDPTAIKKTIKNHLKSAQFTAIKLRTTKFNIIKDNSYL